MLSNLKQDATLWTAAPDGYGGYTYGSPTAIKCRWEDRTELIPGSVEMSKAVAFVSIDLSPEDYILLGTSVASNPTTVGASRVRSFNKIPDLRNLNVLRKVWL